jgi:hypothetical protein
MLPLIENSQSKFENADPELTGVFQCRSETLSRDVKGDHHGLDWQDTAHGFEQMTFNHHCQKLYQLSGVSAPRKLPSAGLTSNLVVS